ncbi:MAG: 8-oxo-dGTP diphosphatase MutT [Bacteroidia bacterium]
MTLDVSCALIEQEGRVLAARRGLGMAHPMQWEFPGGKVQPGETAAEAVVRELAEELGLHIEVSEPLPPFVHTDDRGRSIRLLPFRCRLVAGQPDLREHAEVCWCLPGELSALDWLPADRAIVAWYQTQRGA